MMKIVFLCFVWAALVQALFTTPMPAWMVPNIIFWATLYLGAWLSDIKEAIQRG